MKPDAYTNVILTIIGLCLVYTILRDEQVMAPLFGRQPQQIHANAPQSTRTGAAIPINIAEIDGVPIASHLTRPRDEAIPVRIVNVP